MGVDKGKKGGKAKKDEKEESEDPFKRFVMDTVNASSVDERISVTDHVF